MCRCFLGYVRLAKEEECVGVGAENLGGWGGDMGSVVSYDTQQASWVPKEGVGSGGGWRW